MVRVVLGGGRSGRSSAPVSLDGDGPGRCAPCTSSEPTWGEWFTVRARGHDYIDEDGNPHWTWTLLGEGRGILRDTRSEVDDKTGHTRITATVVMSWPEETALPVETAELVEESGRRWDITAVDGFPGGLRLTMRRVTDAP